MRAFGWCKRAAPLFLLQADERELLTHSVLEASRIARGDSIRIGR